MDSHRHPRPQPRAFPRRTLLALCVLALPLGGCGSDDRVQALEQRLVAVEAKAAAAEKRAKQAEAFAQRAAPSPYVTNDDFSAPEVDPDVNEVTDQSADDPQYDNSVSAPVAPPPAPVVNPDGSA
ncbi:hypothetical protein OLX02_03455 [Novosphingobium sp. KCTC 2891]|uniref:hypothetical protein n=1 Tax=Novosphingobium sp. KCTC 2891 TaxID=2989730 RepID=UPI00222132C0|nr:hypothetical protein [Novosphingobium sp. KCTC 2891]MCW1381873.1 hypothetical protein [Novosphingobium sp. KCTC 2891]